VTDSQTPVDGEEKLTPAEPQAPVDAAADAAAKERAAHWALCLHEAGHAAAIIALGGKFVQAAVLEACGVTEFVLASGSVERCFQVAAGPAAEKLAEIFPVPPGQPGKAEFLRSIEAEHGENNPIRAELDRKFEETPSDDRQVALWSITGHEADDWSWLERSRWARYHADAIVHQKAATIVRIATELWTAGFVTADRLREMGIMDANPAADGGPTASSEAKEI